MKATPDRAAIMRAVRSRDTKPEIAVRKILHSIAPGYRLDREDIPGRPDVAYIGRKLAIFVHGCFWHGHDCKRGARVPKDNRDYWLHKIGRNRARDERTMRELAEKGWGACVVWECELKQPEVLREKLRAFVGR